MVSAKRRRLERIPVLGICVPLEDENFKDCSSYTLYLQ